MPPPTIRPALPQEYDAIARVWMDSWVSTGFGTASDILLAQLRARVPAEVSKRLEPLCRRRWWQAGGHAGVTFAQ